MDISVSDAKALLTDLVRRAEQGEEVVLTRHGQPVARIAPVATPKPTAAQKRAILDEIIARAQRNIRPGPSLKEIEDEMYNEYGMPK